jgi:hypothetical protein
MNAKQPRERIHKIIIDNKTYAHRGDKGDCIICNQKAPVVTGYKTGGKW